MRNENNKNIDNIVYQIVEGGGLEMWGNGKKTCKNRIEHTTKRSHCCFQYTDFFGVEAQEDMSHNENNKSVVPKKHPEILPGI